MFFYTTRHLAELHLNGRPWRRSIAFFGPALMGIVLGVFILFAGALENKWVFVIAAAGGFPLFALGVGSIKKALQALLIFSLSMSIDFHIGYSDSYMNVQPGLPVTFLGIVLVTLYVLWLSDVCLKKASIRLFPWVTLPFALLVCLAGLSYLSAQKPENVLSEFVICVTAFLLYFYWANFLSSPEDIQFVMKCIAVSVLFSAVLGICQYAAGTDFNIGFLGGSDTQIRHAYQIMDISRVSGLLRHPNTYSLFLNALLPLLLVFSVEVKNFAPRLLYRLACILGLIALVLTYSRGGWLALFISCSVMAVIAIRKAHRMNVMHLSRRFLFAAIVGILIVVPFSSSIVTRLTKDDYGNARSRIPLAKMSLKIISQSPMSGVGFGNYQFASPVVVGERGNPLIDPIDGLPMRVHNIFLQIAAELGLPALCLFIWILVSFFRLGGRIIGSHRGSVRLFAVGLVGGLLGMIVHAMFEPETFGDTKYFALMFIGGCLVGLKELEPNR